MRGNHDNGDLFEYILTTSRRAIFRKCDVSVWLDIGTLFFDTWKTFGIIHAVVSNAGINTEANLFKDDIDPETGILMPPNLKTMDVNLNGT